jgi:hypothetical protein
MPFSRQQLRVDPVGHEDAVRPRLRAAAFDRPRAADGGGEWLRSRRCYGLIGSAAPPGRSGTGRLTADSFRAPASWSSTSWRPSWRLRSLSSLVGTPEAIAVRQETERAPADSRPHLDSMLWRRLSALTALASVHSLHLKECACAGLAIHADPIVRLIRRRNRSGLLQASA